MCIEGCHELAHYGSDCRVRRRVGSDGEDVERGRIESGTSLFLDTSRDTPEETLPGLLPPFCGRVTIYRHDLSFSRVIGAPSPAMPSDWRAWTYQDKEHLEGGDKILLPSSALESLARQQVEYPMLFEISNPEEVRDLACQSQHVLLDGASWGDMPACRFYGLDLCRVRTRG